MVTTAMIVRKIVREVRTIDIGLLRRGTLGTIGPRPLDSIRTGGPVTTIGHNPHGITRIEERPTVGIAATDPKVRVGMGIPVHRGQGTFHGL